MDFGLRLLVHHNEGIAHVLLHGGLVGRGPVPCGLPLGVARPVEINAVPAPFEHGISWLFQGDHQPHLIKLCLEVGEIGHSMFTFVG